MKYRSDIDGLRAIAIIPVIFYHAGISLFSGGFIGVDVFFVISGYLIASIIFTEIENRKFSLVNFYERRARRILPALFFVMLSSIIVGWVYMDPFELKELAQSVAATGVFASNFYFSLKVDYFDISAELKPLLHTWSLAVEEQYYFFFPLIVMLIWGLTKSNKKILLALLCVIALFSFSLAIKLNESSPVSSFYLLHTRAWELLLGAIVALLTQMNVRVIENDNVRQMISGAAILSIIVCITVYDSTLAYPGVYTLIPVTATCLLIFFNRPEHRIFAILSHRILVYIGLISYSLYLWHQPIFAFARVISLEELTPLLAGISIILTFALAAFTKHFVEDPIRHKKVIKSRIGAFSNVAIVSAAFILFGLFGHLKNGYPERNELSLRLAQNYGLSSQCSGAAFESSACKTGEAPSVFVWGDSYAMHLAQAVQLSTEESLMQMTMSGCPPIVGFAVASRKSLVSCEEYNQKVIEYFEAQANETHTIYLSISNWLDEESTREKFKATLSRLKATNANVIIISPTPINPNTLKCIKRQSRGDGSFAQCNYDIESIENDVAFTNLIEVSKELKVTFIDLRGLLCDKGICQVVIGDTIMFRDPSHLSNESKTIVARFMADGRE